MTGASLRASIATKHGKEMLFAPAFERLGIEVVVADVDTDEFGTFAGEIERSRSALETVERKARAAIESTGTSIGLASEGSFGPHPDIPFALVDTELVAYIDTTLDHVVIDRESRISRVPAAATVEHVEQIESLRIVPMLAEQAAIVVSEELSSNTRRVHAKGITNIDELRGVVTDALEAVDGPVIVEPDLRAHMCADRRVVIAAAIDRLVARLATRCPRCDAPGIGPIRTIPGQPCALCGLPTTRPAGDVLGCNRCGFECETSRSGFADPTHCDRCNP